MARVKAEKDVGKEVENSYCC